MNPDDLLALIRAAQNNPRLMVRPDVNRGAGQELSTKKLTDLRAWVKEQRAAGVSDQEIDSAIQGRYRKSLEHVLKPTTGDYQRSALSGATFGLNDEIAGLLTKAIPGGAGYKETRDIVRANQAGARYVAPKRMLATEIAGGIIPGLMTAGAAGVGARGLGAGERALAAAETGGGLGALGGFGHSEATTPGGLADDVGSGFAVGTGLGLAGSSLASLIRGIHGKFSPTQAVMREAKAVLPENAPQAIARQEQLAPGTAILGDQSPEMTVFARAVGADREAAKRAVSDRAKAISELDKARRSVGARYQKIDQVLPVDDELKALVGSRLTLGTEIGFKELHTARSEIGRKLRDAQRAYKLTGEKGDVIAELTPIKQGLDAWLTARIPEVAKIDNDYGAVMGMLQNARRAEKVAKQSLASHAASRAAGMTATSPGGSLTKTPGVTDALAKLISPNKAKRARIIQKYLMSPEGRDAALRLMAPPESMFPSLNRGLLFGASSSIPGLIGQ